MLVIIVVILLIGIGLFLKNQTRTQAQVQTNTKKAIGEISAKPVMTENEIHFYEKLKQLLPRHTIFSQVAFSAFLHAKDYATRATYNRKIIDFVVLDQHYQVICLIELDDNSHRNRADQDQQRDEICTKAGYRVVRFASQPHLDQMKEQLHFLIAPDVQNPPRSIQSGQLS